MTIASEDFTIDVGLNTSGLRSDLGQLSKLSRQFGRTITASFTSAITSGRKFSSVLRSLVLSLSRQALSSAIRPLGNALGGLVGNLFGSGITASARGNVVSGGAVKPFAGGGIVNSPVLFPLRSGTGLMGEAGPEAILPLARGSDGRLGVRNSGSASVNVTMNITTPDVAGFQGSQSQIAASLIRALERGNRNL